MCNLTECYNDPCQHKGTCRPTESGGYTCGCPSGWKGTNCEIDENECKTGNGEQEVAENVVKT